MSDQKLKKSLGFWDLLLFGVGGIVGAGIYAIIGQAADLSGNLLWLSFTISAIVAMLTGLSYAEFVSRFPDAGGSFEYIKQGFSPKTAIFMSIFMTFTGVVAAAAIAISFADYLSRLWDISATISIVVIVVLMAFFNIIGSKYSSYYNSFATIVTLLGLGMVIVVCLPDFDGNILFDFENSDMHGLMAGAALIFFSYVGFEDLVKMAEDAKEPKKDMPKAILLSGTIVLLVYILIAFSAICVMDASQLAKKSGPLAAVIESKMGTIGATILVVVALFATSKTILSNILGTSRLLFDVARDTEIKWLRKFTTISGIGNAPNYAIFAITLLVIAFALIGNLKIVASISNIFIFIVFGMVNIALIRYRLKNGNKDDGDLVFHVPLTFGKVPIPTVLALITILLLFGYNMYNLFQGNAS